MERFDILTGRDDEKTGKTYWTKIGAAFPAKGGDGFSIILDALPLSGKMIARKPLPARDYKVAPGSDSAVPF